VSLTRTPAIDVDKEFTVDIPVTKAYVDTRTGERHIVGVATGVAEDRDGERVSKNAIVGMGRTIEQGGVKVTSSHQQDWMTEIGDVVKYDYDAESDEMIVDGVLPPEGEDPIADKAWKTANKPGRALGWSIGGKLLKSYFERNELGKRRKVLDAIDLRHVMLTEHPAYQNSFAQAVAKTWDGEEPADDAFTENTEVEKATTGSWASGDSDSGGGNVGRDSVGSGQRNAGTSKPGTKRMNTEDDGTDEDKSDQDLPEAKNERHLACPNCGHEFAADLPVDPDERQVDDTNTNDQDEDQDDTGKSKETPLMTKLADTLADIRALAEGAIVNKTETEPTEPAAATETTETDVAKTATEATDVEKMLAASHQATNERINSIESTVGEALELVAKSHKAIMDRFDALPQGRKSTARVLPPTTGHDASTVEKTFEERIEEAPDLTSALKIANERMYGVRAEA
jgi:hypothetical protein